jgi:hypothetical protein
MAAPAPRSWDLAGALWRWVPLSPTAADGPPTERARRIAIFCAAYGWSTPARLLPIVQKRQRVELESIERWSAGCLPGFAGILAGDQIAAIQRDIAYLVNQVRDMSRELGGEEPAPFIEPTELSINGRSTIVADLATVRRLLAEVAEENLSEVWISDLREDARALSLLTHRGVGWLMHLRCNGDAGSSSRNPAYDGPPNAKLNYILSNGQEDWYPASWAIPRSEAFRAVEHFLVTRERAPWVTWHDDADGEDCCAHYVDPANEEPA